MREEGLRVKIKKRKKYNSYRGEITPAVPNLVKRNFHSDKPEKLLLTDISEFALPAGKVYLSPMLDCFDGYLITWKIGLYPNADLVNSMLDETIERLKSDAKPIIHTDRGRHYRWPGWIERMKDNNFTRSMSKKGCSPDNAACEGLFGRIKNEFFYCQDWMGVSLNEFMKELDEYLHWYNEERIKESLGFMSPEEYRGFSWYRYIGGPRKCPQPRNGWSEKSVQHTESKDSHGEVIRIKKSGGSACSKLRI